MLRIFKKQEERRLVGGSCFIELQYCKLSPKARIQKIVCVDSIDFWLEDSLYIHWDAIEQFLAHYSKLFDGGVYNNLKSGPPDIYGANYYCPQFVAKMKTRLEKEKPPEYSALLEWLKDGAQYNGIYLLGI